MLFLGIGDILYGYFHIHTYSGVFLNVIKLLLSLEENVEKKHKEENVLIKI